jgi:hypothetical protein
MAGATDVYHRYHIEALNAPEVAHVPSRFRVRVKRAGLAGLILKELIHYRGNLEVVLSRPCLYGVFSGPVGGFSPREHLCVGCLRCTTQYPEFVQILPNLDHASLGDSYFTPAQVDTVYSEARTGRVPVKGAGYRGPFGGHGWDAMWTDMSEIVRPTRDGIHGREFISTSVDLGPKPPFLMFDAAGRAQPAKGLCRVLSIPVPILFDAPPASLASSALLRVLERAAEETETLFLSPAGAVPSGALSSPAAIPLVRPGEEQLLARLTRAPRAIEVAGPDESFLCRLRERFPGTDVWLRLESGSAGDLVGMARAGARTFHLLADYHGRWPDGRFILDVIRDVHSAFVAAGIRDEVTLLGSGGIIAAEHVVKAILCGLDAVVLDTPLLVALQAQFHGECAARATSRFSLPARLDQAWAVQRLKNLLAAWRDQALELMGAMGIREVRRMRGEIGRAMFQAELEQEAFAGIEGYEHAR